MNWLYYLLEANLYLGVFYLAYCLFLNKETYYAFNRVYLIASCVIAFVLPVLQVSSLKQYFTPDAQVVQAPLAVTPTYVVAPIPQMAYSLSTTAPQPVFTADDALYYGYWVGAAIVLILLMTKLISLFKLISSKPVLNHDNYKLIYLDDLNTAFSFFNYLFIGRRANNSPIIIRHELVHIRQKHSFDILFLEVLKVINWFNPLIYLVQKSLKTVHEYIADQESLAEDNDTTTYSAFLVNNAYGLSGPSITHSFYTYNLLKNRIIMLHQKRSGSLARLKYLVAVPIGAGLLCASTMAFSKTYGWIDLAPKTNIAEKLQTPPQQKAPVAKKQIKPLPPEPPKPKFDQVKFPPPIVLPDFKPEKTYVNAKGYNIEEGGYTYKGMKYYQVIISDPSGKKLEQWAGHKVNKLRYYKNANSKKQEKMLLDKYGYTFPDVEVSALPEPPKPKFDQVRFPPPIVKLQPISERNFRAFTGLRDFLTKNIQYPDAAREKKISGVVTAHFNIDDNGNVAEPFMIQTNEKDFNDAIVTGLKAYTDKISATKGSYNIVFTFRASKNDQLKFPSPTSSNRNFAGIINIATEKSLLIDFVRFPPPEPPKPKVDQIKFPPPIVKPDKAGQLKRKELPPPPEPPKPKTSRVKTDVIKFPTVVLTVPNVFYKNLQQEVHYPKSLSSKNIQGDILISFAVTGNKIKNIKVEDGKNADMIAEVKRALYGFTTPQNMSSGLYTIKVTFAIGTEQQYPRSTEMNYPVVSTRYNTQTVDYVPLNEITIVDYI